MIRSLLYFLVGVLVLLNPVSSVASAADVTKPNILFFLIDDQRNDTLGCAGHPIIQTPVIDRLAAEGVRFENAFVTTPICAASRASIFTGLHETSHGFTFGEPPLKKGHMEKSYPMLLRKAGYRTGFIGKYGVKTEGEPESEMFDLFEPHDRLPFLMKQKDGTLRHESEVAADKAITFLKASADGKPFCLSVSFKASHANDGDLKNHFPWSKAVDGMYEEIEIPSPRLGDASIYENHPDFFKGSSMARKRFHWRWDTPEKYQKNMKAYFRMISGVDHAIGRVRHSLEETGLAANTIIIYMADNGYFMGDRGFAGKWSHYEQSLRVPLIVFDPRAAKERRGAVVNQPTLNIDLAPTLIELAGISQPRQYQGSSYVPLLHGADPSDWRKDFFCEHLMENESIPKWEGVRGERFVYAHYFDQNPSYEFLHDLKADPDQLSNLAKNPEYQRKLIEMRRRCRAIKTLLKH
ncbi:MAG: sulfatase [Verrucomicrobiae bacterium]|nr:sulfatase [Verrucomicrobiae bacterium]NNJ42366.1 sulfatase [Akkermansiaceae bacterium]